MVIHGRKMPPNRNVSRISPAGSKIFPILTHLSRIDNIGIDGIMRKRILWCANKVVPTCFPAVDQNFITQNFLLLCSMTSP